jgi:hypothetical protein
MPNVSRHNQDEAVKSEKAKSTSAVDLAIFAQTLLSQRTPRLRSAESSLPVSVAHLEIVPPARSIEEKESWEREQHEREQTLLGEVLTELKGKARGRKRCLRLFGAAGAAALGLGGLMLVDAVSVSLMTPAFLIASFAALLAAARGTRLHSEITMLVPTLPTSDVRAIGPLLEALSYADMDGIPQYALMELLPRLAPADAALFSDKQRQNFHRALTDTNTDLVTLVLKALEKIGDGRAVPHVARLAAGEGRARIDPQVLYAAQHCLPVLEARSVYDSANHTLLRPTSPPPADGEQLLRSVQEPVIAADELLRSSVKATLDW